MQSLKELRAKNAARLNRTTEDVVAASSEHAPGDALAATAPAAGTPATAATVGVPRAGRTLAPLSSTGSIPGASGRGGTRNADSPAAEDGQQGDREKRRRRRRRRRERERDEDEDGGSSEAPTLSLASLQNMSGEGDMSAASAGEEGAKRDGGLDAKREVNASGEIDMGAVYGSSADAGLPHNARGAPPQEEPKKKLSPLAARRARIEQQKRAEADRKEEESRESLLGNSSPPPSDSRGEGQGQRKLAEKGNEFKPERKANAEESFQEGLPDTEDRAASGNLSAARTGGAARHRGKGGVPGEGEENNHTESDPLISDAVGESHEASNPGRQAGVAESGIGGAGGGHDEAAEADELDDAGESRFQSMRSRMKKAKDIMNRRTSTTFRLGKPEGRPLRGSTRSQEKGDVEVGHSGEPTASDDKRDEGLSVVGGDTDPPRTSNYLQPNQEDSDTSSNDSAVASPAPSEVEKGDFVGEVAAETGGNKGRTAKRGRGKGRPEAAVGGNKEVTLGHVVDRKMREMGYIRKPAVEDLKNRRSLRDRVAAEEAPEVHFIGEVSGAEGFGSGVSCCFRVEGGRHWTCLAGLEEGQTHVMHIDYGETFAPWNHPIDLHYTTKSIQGWPRLMVQVWQLDTHGRNVLRGYGFRHLPSTPGFSEVSVPCWRPTGTMQEETAAFFLGVTPRLTTEDSVFNRAWDQRCRLVTLPAGTVWIQMNGLFRNLQDQDVDSLPGS